MELARITGTVVVEERKKGRRVYIAVYITAAGSKTRRVLGTAHVKDSGKKTPKGGTVWRAADGPKPTAGSLTPRDAQDRLAAILHQEEGERRQGGGRALQATGRTVRDAAEEFLRYHEVDRGTAPSTLRNYRSIIHAHVIPAFGETRALRGLTAQQIETYQSELLERGLGRSTVRSVMIVTRGVLKRAVRLGWLAHNPMADVEIVPQPKPEVEFNVLTVEQIEQVARAIDDGWEPQLPGGRRGTVVSEEVAASVTVSRRRQAELHAAMVRVAAYTGLRLGELRALRWRDLDWAGEVLRVSRNAPASAPAGHGEKAPKSSQGRSVPLIPPAIVVLDGLSKRTHFTGPDDLVFPSPLGGHLDDGKARSAFYAGLDAVGLGHLRAKGVNPMTFHDLRHVFGSLAVRTFTVPEVQGMMGHSDIATTMRYVHYVPRHDAAARLAQAFAPAGAETTSTAVVA